MVLIVVNVICTLQFKHRTNQGEPLCIIAVNSVSCEQDSAVMPKTTDEVHTLPNAVFLTGARIGLTPRSYQELLQLGLLDQRQQLCVIFG